MCPLYRVRHRPLPSGFAYSAAMHAMPLSDFVEAQARAAKWLAAWDGQGIHRTAIAGDLAGAEWLAQEAAALGAEVTIEEFALDRLDPTSCFVEFGVRQIVAVPVFDAPATDPQGLARRPGRLWREPQNRRPQ